MPAPAGFVLWQLATEGYADGVAGRGVAKAHHAPPGGEDSDGKHYEGGQFAPDPSREVTIIEAKGKIPTEPKAARAWALAKVGGAHKNAATGWDISVSGKGIREAIARLNWPPEVAIHPLAAIPDLIRHAVPIQAERDKKGRDEILAIHTFLAPIQIEGEVYRARMVIRETNMGRKYYGHHLESLDIEKPEALSVGLSQNKDEAIRQHSGTLKLGQLMEAVKRRPERDVLKALIDTGVPAVNLGGLRSRGVALHAAFPQVSESPSLAVSDLSRSVKDALEIFRPQAQFLRHP